MKKYFITGLVILLPVTLTFILIAFVFNLLTGPFIGISRAIVNRYPILEHGFLFFTAEDIVVFFSQILILLLLFGFTVFLGFITRWFFVHAMIRFWEKLVTQIPLVSSIYTGSQDVIKTIFTSKTSAFKQVVLVRFPNTETQAIGLVTRDTFPGLEKAVEGDLVSVFVPTTPNPTSGFLTIFRKEDVIPLDMKIEDAFKYVISCGVIVPSFQAPKADPKPEELNNARKLATDQECLI